MRYNSNKQKNFARTAIRKSLETKAAMAYFFTGEGNSFLLSRE